jgi:hypothetical protein
VQVEETPLSGMADFITVNANHTFIVDHDEAIRQALHFLEHGRFEHGAFDTAGGSEGPGLRQGPPRAGPFGPAK